MKKTLFIVALASTLAACGFTLRGAYTFPFATATLEVPRAAPDFEQQLRRALTADGAVRLVELKEVVGTDVPLSAAAKHVRVRVLEVFNDKRILSLSSGGRVREFLIEQRVKFDVLDAFDKELVPARTLTVTREFSFSDAQALAKEGEERLLRADMQNDLVTQILRQLQAARRAP
jgi:LPS-assembly lipoprotein